MKKVLMLFAAILIPIVALSAGNAPRIIQCGIDPVTISPGENFTLFADVVDPDGFSDVAEVNLLISNMAVLKVPQAPSDSSRFAQTFTMPESVNSGTYTLSMVAVDSMNASSDVSFFSFSISDDGPAVELISPDEGAQVDCHGVTVFEWMPFEEDIAGYVMSLILSDGVSVSVELPPETTALPVPGFLWSMIPDGQYFWQVGVISKDGGEPYAWSELRSFLVECGSPFPTEVFGRVVEKDELARTLLIQTRIHCGNSEVILIQVSDETVILDAQGQEIDFADITVDSKLLAIGEFINEVFVAQRIHLADHHQPPSGDHIAGQVVNVDTDLQTITIRCREQESEVLISVTDDTIIEGHQGPMTLSDIETGNFLNAIGNWENTTFVASLIRVAVDPGPGPGDHFTGRIDSIDIANNSFTLRTRSHDNHGITTISVIVTSETVIESPNGPLTLQDLIVDMIAYVEGDWQERDSDPALIARFIMIHDNPGPPDPPADHISGTVVSIDIENMNCQILPHHSNSPELFGVQATESTRIVSRTGPCSFQDIITGMELSAEGVMTENTILAEFICIQQ